MTHHMNCFERVISRADSWQKVEFTFAEVFSYRNILDLRSTFKVSTLLVNEKEGGLWSLSTARQVP